MRDFHFTIILAALTAALAAFIFLNGGGWIGLGVYLVVLAAIIASAAC